MKKVLRAVVILLVIAGLAACSASGQVTVSFYDPSGISPLPTVTASPSLAHLPTPEPIPSVSASPQASTTVYNGTFIIADHGAVIGGCSDGKWLTHVKAAALCRNKKTFYAYDLTGYLATIKSQGLEDENGDSYDDEDLHVEDSVDDGYANSWSCDYQYAHTYFEYYLDIPDVYSQDYIYTVPPNSFPAVTLLTDTSSLIPAIQEIIDGHLGKNAPKTHLRTAAQCDIDSDGKLEIIVNADNCMGKVEDGEYSNVYCIACIIENDGSIHTVYDFYIGKNESSDVEYAYIKNVIDIDGDSKCEIVVNWSEFNAWKTDIYKYDGNKFTKVFSYDIES